MELPDSPTLYDSDGNPIAVFRRPNGDEFSNHPEYMVRKQIHEQNAAAEKATAERAARLAADRAAAEDLDTDEEETSDEDGDGTISYEEMSATDLKAAAAEKGITIPKGTKRTGLIEMLNEADSVTVSTPAEG